MRQIKGAHSWFAAFSADGKRLVSGGYFDNTVRVWDAATGQELRSYEGHTDAMTGVAFFPDAGYPYLQIYTPPHRESIAVENLSGAPNCFNNKMGLLLLQSGHSQIFTVRYKVSVE